MPPLGLLTIATYLPEDFSLRLIDRNVAEESASDWEWADVVFLSVMMAQREDYQECVATAKMRGKITQKMQNVPRKPSGEARQDSPTRNPRHGLRAGDGFTPS